MNINNEKFSLPVSVKIRNHHIQYLVIKLTNMGGHNQNKLHTSQRDESRSQTRSQSNKRQRPNSDTESSQNLTQDLSDLSSVLENLLNDKETLNKRQD